MIFHGLTFHDKVFIVLFSNMTLMETMLQNQIKSIIPNESYQLNYILYFPALNASAKI